MRVINQRQDNKYCRLTHVGYVAGSDTTQTEITCNSIINHTYFTKIRILQLFLQLKNAFQKCNICKYTFKNTPHSVMDMHGHMHIYQLNEAHIHTSPHTYTHIYIYIYIYTGNSLISYSSILTYANHIDDPCLLTMQVFNF